MALVTRPVVFLKADLWHILGRADLDSILKRDDGRSAVGHEQSRNRQRLDFKLSHRIRFPS